MMTSHPADLPGTTTVTSCFRTNLKRVLAVAGPQHNALYTPLKLSAGYVHKKTGIARSTLLNLTRGNESREVNPDLKTICAIAEALDLPPAFLLMRPEDWTMLNNAIALKTSQFDSAVLSVVRDGVSAARTNDTIRTLEKQKVHPERPPHGFSSNACERDKAAAIQLSERNEWRRRASFKLEALMLQDDMSQEERASLIAMAAACIQLLIPPQLKSGI